ncbi:hypothetical protein ZIOFF_053062 [Zingiber officinale]|uniref:Uncharacterized protein n=1 Tax=Zingiber officinale TaxID=94328 RepID=A0A8J5FCN0_ZINOF|nr:hypothetical protein ZIOFF_053062 [Zingiber officinale]
MLLQLVSATIDLTSAMQWQVAIGRTDSEAAALHQTRLSCSRFAAFGSELAAAFADCALLPTVSFSFSLSSEGRFSLPLCSFSFLFIPRKDFFPFDDSFPPSIHASESTEEQEGRGSRIEMLSYTAKRILGLGHGFAERRLHAALMAVRGYHERVDGEERVKVAGEDVGLAFTGRGDWRAYGGRASAAWVEEKRGKERKEERVKILGYDIIDEDADGDLVWEPVHGEGDVETPEGMADEDDALALGQRGQEVDQGLVVVGEVPEVGEAALVDAGSGEIKRGDSVPGGAEKGDELVPTPGAVGDAVNEDDVVAAVASGVCHVKTRRRRLPSGENTKEKAVVGGKCEGEGYHGENVKKKVAVGRGDAKKTIEENEKEKLPSGENVKEKNAK